MSTPQPIDVRDMVIVHPTFRQAYEESARLVRAAPVSAEGRDRRWRQRSTSSMRSSSPTSTTRSKVVPLAAVTFTQKEWDAVGKRGAAWIPVTRGVSPSG
jgi:hypothetical protein